MFSALHDTMLGEVSPVPMLCFPGLHDPQLLSSVQIYVEKQPIWHMDPPLDNLSSAFVKPASYIGH